MSGLGGVEAVVLWRDPVSSDLWSNVAQTSDVLCPPKWSEMCHACI